MNNLTKRSKTMTKHKAVPISVAVVLLIAQGSNRG